MKAQYFIAADLRVAELSMTERRFAARPIAKKIFAAGPDDSEGFPIRTVRTCGHPAWWIVLPDLRQHLKCREKI